MGYALFTARKLSVTTRLNSCNAQLMSLTEKEYSLSSSIFAKQNASALNSTKASQEAYTKYANTVNGLDSTSENYNSAKKDAENELNKALAEIDTQTAMSDAEIQELNQLQTNYDLQKKRCETQLNAYQNELESVEKAEQNAIKKSAPNFS